MLLGVRVLPIPVLGNGGKWESESFNCDKETCCKLGSSNLHPLNRNNLPQHLTSSTLLSYFLIPLNSPVSLAVMALVLPPSAPILQRMLFQPVPWFHAYPICTVFTLCYNSSFRLPALYYELFDNKVIHFPFLNPHVKLGPSHMKGDNGGLLND